MKEGYIVWNQTNYGDGFEIFGVFRSEKMAYKHLRKVIKDRYGKCPDPAKDFDAFWRFVCDVENTDVSGDVYKITPFTENEGEGWSPYDEDLEE